MITHIRKLTGLDIEAYRDMRLLSLQTDPDAFFLQYSYTKDLPQTFFLHELLSGEDPYGFYGAFANDELVGMISVQRIEEDVVQLFTLYVKKPFRHKGIGKMLVEHVLTVAAFDKTVRLTVIAGNPAIALYTSLGFIQTDMHKGALVNERGTFDELIFQRKM